MKLVSYYLKNDDDRELRRGVLLEEGVVAVPGEFNALGGSDLAEIQAYLQQAGKAQVLSLSEVRLGPPVPAPPKIICVGLNYYDHASEVNMPIPTTPILFGKWGNSLAGPEDEIVLDGTSERVDYEAELTFVIGKTAYKVSEAEAMNYIAGYMCSNDVSARDLQFVTPNMQWARGKSLNGYCPVGPFLATKDEISDPHNLKIACRVNGQTLQDSNTDQLIFKIPFLLSHISQGITLQPGDIVLTGTPHGVGFTRNPPIFMKAGDVCEIEIEGLGVLRNTFVQG